MEKINKKKYSQLNIANFGNITWSHNQFGIKMADHPKLNL